MIKNGSAKIPKVENGRTQFIVLETTANLKVLKLLLKITYSMGIFKEVYS